MGGEITWRCSSTNQYIFTVKIYTDCNGIDFNNNSITLQANNYPNPGNINSFNIPRKGLKKDISASCGSVDPCSITGPGQPFIAGAIEEHVFENTTPITLNGVPGVNGWIFTYDGFSRNNALSNIVNPGGQGMTLRAKMFAFNNQNASTCYDNSPSFSEIPASVLCVGDEFTYNHNAQDDELDSLVYSWAQPLDDFNGLYTEGLNPSAVNFVTGYNFNSPFPGTTQDPNNIPATLNTENGEITYKSFTSGAFVSVIRVEAYRCGQKIAEIYRDIQTVLLSSAVCPANDPPFIRAPFQSSPGVYNVYRDTVKAGDLVTFNLQATDLPSATNPNTDSVFVFASGLQFGANFTDPNSGCLNPPCATLSNPLPGKGFLAYQSTFNWQTTCDHISYNDGCVSLNNTYNFVIRATDNSCPAPGQKVTTISITVLADELVESPDIYCLNVKQNGDVDINFSQPIDTTNSFDAWLIYSGQNPNGPFTLIDSILNYNTLSYTHVGAGANLAPRYYYVRSRSGCLGRVINVAKDTLSTIFVTTAMDTANSCVRLNWNRHNPRGAANTAYRIFRNGVQVATVPAGDTTFCDPLSSCSDTLFYQIRKNNPLGSCQSRSNVDDFLFVGDDPVANFSFVTACAYDTVAFTDLSTIASSFIANWSWDFGDGIGTSNLQNPTYTYAVAGNYTVTLIVQSAIGCTDTIRKVVSLDPLPLVNAGPDTSFCAGQGVRIGGSPTTSLGNKVIWFPSTGLNFDTVFNPIANPIITTSYTVIVTDGKGCNAGDTVLVTVNPLPNADAGADIAICLNDSQLIGGSPAGPAGATFIWSPTTGLSNPNIANPLASPTSNTRYILTVVSAQNCLARDTMVVTVNPLPLAEAGRDTAVCDNEPVTIGGSPSGPIGATYVWSPAIGLNNPSIANPTVTTNVTTTYILTVSDTNACTAVDSVRVETHPYPIADAGGSLAQICFGDSLQLGGSPTGPIGATYLWTPATFLNSDIIANPVSRPLNSLFYFVEVTDTFGCASIDSTFVDVRPLPQVNAGLDQFICDGVGVIIGGNPTGPSGSTYLWSPANGLSDPTIENPTANPASTTTYTVIVRDTSGCIDSASVTVTVNPLPLVDAGGDTEICLNDSVVIGGLPTGPIGSTYEWMPGTDINDITIANPTVSPKVTTNYIVIVTDTNGCSSSDTVRIAVKELPIVEAGDSAYLCPGFSVQLAASGANTYDWDFSTTLSSLTIARPLAFPLVSTLYYVTGTDTNGCSNRDSVFVDVSSTVPTNAGNDKLICLGDEIQIGTSNQSPAGTSFLWQPAIGLDDPTLEMPIASPNTTTNYYLYTLNDTCSGIDSMTVVVNPVPYADFDIDFMVNCDGLRSEVTNLSVNAFDFFWNVNGSDDTINAFEPQLQLNYDVTNLVTLIAENNNCFDTTTKSIDIAALENYLDLIKTNVFTPNGDGINDVFRISFKGEFINCSEITIFNRWGETVYESNAERGGWDGRTLSGEKAPSGTYFYVVKIGETQVKGSVLLTR